MLHVAIVEDDEAMQRWLRGKLTEQFSAARAAAEFDLFGTGDSFLAMAGEHYLFDAVFLDIEMPGTEGIETARRFTALQPEARILFVSGREDLVFETFEVQPFRFLPKSRLEEMLPGAVEALVKDIEKNHTRRVVFTDTSGDLFSFTPGRIIYIEALNKDCRIVTLDGETQVRCRLLDLERQLEGEGFIKIHRSYIINPSFLYLIDRLSVSLTTGEQLPLARNRASEVRRAFLHFAGDN